MLRWILIIGCLVHSTQFYGQNTLKGSVTDESGEALIGCNVVINNTTRGTIAGVDGEFQIESDSFPIELVFSYIGYSDTIVEVSDTSYLEVVLNDDSTIITCGPYGPPISIYSTPIKFNVPAPLTQINKRQLDRDNDISITPSLNRVPGVYMHSGALNTNRITIRGIGNRSLFSTTKIRAYLDDIPLTTGDGETTIEDIDLSIIEKVDVWKGPTASMYGAGLGGMIHLQTYRNLNTSGSNYMGTRFSLGSYGLFRSVSNLSLVNDQKTMHFNFNYNRTKSDGYRDNNEYKREGINILGVIQSDDKNKTTILADYKKVKAFIPSSLNRSDFDENPSIAAFTWAQVQGFEDNEKLLLGISHKSTFKELRRWNITNKSSIFSSFRTNYESRPFNILDETSQTIGLRSSFEFNKSRDFNNLYPNFSIGLELFQEKYNWQTFVTNEGNLGEHISDNEEDRKYINLFAQSYWRWDRWTLLTGVNVNHTGYDYRDKFRADNIDLSGSHTFKWIASPRLGVNYEIKNRISTFANISHGFSPPSLEETLTPVGNINPNIQPEKGWNFEIGSRGNIDYKLYYELTLYQMNVNDLLVADRVGEDQFVGVNAGKTKHRGLEAFIEYYFLMGANTLSVFGSYAYKDYTFIDFLDETNDFSGNDLTGTPPHNFNAGIDFKLKHGVYGNLNYQFVDAFPMRDDNSIFSDSYQVSNLKIGYKKSIGRDKINIDVYAGIQNTFDEKYASMILINAGSFGGNAPRYYYPGLPRNYFAGIELKYYLDN